MSGGLMQLVAYGSQDVYLTGNPHITFFKVVYKRHTNFAIEAIEQTFSGSSGFGRRVAAIINRQGDLITRMYLKVVLNGVHLGSTYNETSVAWVRRVGFALVKSVEIEIGGAKIDRHYGTWLDVWYELTHCADEERGYKAMIGDVEELTKLKKVGDASNGNVLDEYTLFVPLQFWFCRNTGLALPLVALQYHETRLFVDFEEANKLIVWSGTTAPDTTEFKIKDASVLVDYIYLDTEERRRFAQMGHEYLIEQVQNTGTESISDTSGGGLINSKYKLSFNHPTKELVWALKVGAFNGEGITSNNLNKGKFLCYTHDDSKWSEALDYAATNIANGMFSFAYSTRTTVEALRSNSVLASGNLVYFDYTSANNTVTANSLNLKLYVSFEDADTGDVVSDGDADTAGADGLSTVNVIVNTKPLSDATFNLATNLTSVDLVVKVTRTSGKVTGVATTNFKVVTVLTHKLTMNDASIPVDEWTDTRATADKALDVTVIQPSNYGVRLDGKGNPVREAMIQLNGYERFHAREGNYFNYVQTYQHHKRTPTDGVNVYSFALNPENHQPSGSANLSRIDTTQLVVTFGDPFRYGKTVPKLNLAKDSQLNIYALSYNVLRIMSGMGGLAYSN